MKNEDISPTEVRKQRFFLVLPAFVVPFMTLFFYLFGGGKGLAAPGNQSETKAGFNLNLPTARLQDNRALDKMSFYEQADRDSQKIRESINNDPYAGGRNGNSLQVGGTQDGGGLWGIKTKLLKEHPEWNSNFTNHTATSTGFPRSGVDSNEQKVYQKIEQLNQTLKTVDPASSRSSLSTPPPGSSPDVHQDVARLENMLQTMKQQPPGGTDPQLQYLNGMLDKIAAIQNPPSRDSLQRLSMKNKGKTYPVTSTPEGEDNISMLPSPDSSHRESRPSAASPGSVGFYGLDDGPPPHKDQNVFTATIDESQTLVSGADVRLRLTSELYVNGTLIPVGTPLTGVAALSGERLRVEISSVRYENAIYPVSLSVYDVDGSAGIYIPGSINRDVSKESADQAVGGMGILPTGTDIGSQLAGASINAARTLVSRKIKLVRVTVKDGYQVFLKDTGN